MKSGAGRAGQMDRKGMETTQGVCGGWGGEVGALRSEVRLV